MKKSALGWLLVLPAFSLLTLFVFWPAIQSIYLSFRDVEPFSQRSYFTGLRNFKELLTSEEYRTSHKESYLCPLLTVVPSVVFSLWIALFLVENPYLRNLLSTLFLMPVAISSAMAAMLWIFIYNPTAGVLNYFLEVVGLTGPNWLGDPFWALVALAIATLWKEMGFNIIFYLAGLSSVPTDLREAARLDGAGFLKTVRHVVIPILSPTILFVTVVSTINSLQSFGQIHVLTAGGPAGSTRTLVYNLYLDAFSNFRTGYASSQAVVLFALLLVATSIQFAVAKKRVHYG